MHRDAVSRLHGSVAPTTVVAYERELALCQAWLGEHGLSAELPLDAAVLILYLEFVCQTRGPNCASKALVAINKVHLFRMMLPPKSRLLQTLFRSFQKLSKRQRDPVKVDDLPIEVVLAWARHVLSKGDVMDRGDLQAAAGLALGVRAVKRAGDLSKIRLCDVRHRVEGGHLVFFPDTKNHPEGEHVPIDEVLGGDVCPSRLLGAWWSTRLDEGAVANDWLFARADGSPLNSKFWTAAIRKAVTFAESQGVVPEGGRWSSKSLRNGGTAVMQRLGFGETAIQALGGWSSDAMKHYLRKTQLARDGLSTKMFTLQ